MGKTKASASRVISFTKKLGNFISFISCDKGDVYITCKNMSEFFDPDNYIPDFRVESKQRTLEMNIFNTAGNDFVVKSALWYINGSLANTQTAFFEATVDSLKTPCLKIKGPIATLTNNEPITITVKAQVANTMDDVDTVEVMAAYNIPVGLAQEGAYRVMIASCNDDANYTIVDKNVPLELQCLTYDWLGNDVLDGLSYKWYKLDYDQAQGIVTWDELATTTQTISIPESMVDNQARIKVEVYKDGNCIGEDTQVIYDNQDVFELDVTPSVPTENLTEGDTVQQIDYKVAIRSRDTNQSARRAKISFYLYDTVGVSLQAGDPSMPVYPRPWKDLQWVKSGAQTGEYSPTSVMFTVYAADFQNGGTSLTLNICAEIES